MNKKRPKNHWRRWTDAERARFADAWQSGTAWRSLTAMFGRSRTALVNAAKRLGLPARVQGMVTLEEAARRLGCAHTRIRSLVRRHAIPLHRHRAVNTQARGDVLTALEWDVVREAYEREAAQASVAAHAKRLGMHPITLRMWLRRAGVIPAAARGSCVRRLDTETVDRVVRAQLARDDAHGYAAGAVPLRTARALAAQYGEITSSERRAA